LEKTREGANRITKLSVATCLNIVVRGCKIELGGGNYPLKGETRIQGGRGIGIKARSFWSSKGLKKGKEHPSKLPLNRLFLGGGRGGRISWRTAGPIRKVRVNRSLREVGGKKVIGRFEEIHKKSLVIHQKACPGRSILRKKRQREGIMFDEKNGKRRCYRPEKKYQSVLCKSLNCETEKMVTNNNPLITDTKG